MTGKKSKIVSLVLIALMLGAIFGALPAIYGASESENGTISMTITDDSGDAVPAGFVVNLYNIYADSMTNYTLTTAGYMKIDVPAGHYVIDLPQQISGGKAYLSNHSEIFAVDSGKTVTLSLQTVAKDLKNKVSGTVTYSGNPVEGASVEFVDYANNFVFSTTTDENGNYSIMVYDGHYSLWAEKKGIGRAYDSGNITADSTINIPLQDVPYIKGFVFDQDGNGIESELHVTIYNESGKIVKNYIGNGPFFKVPAFQGEFSVLIAAYGYDSYYNASVSVSSSADTDLGDIQLHAIDPSSDNTVFTFKDGFENMSMVRTLTYAPYDAITASSCYNSANMRYQFDTNHDGTVNASEAARFINVLQTGMQPVSTGESLMVNGVSYDISGTATVTVSGVEGPVSSSDPINIEVSADFKADDNITTTDGISISAQARYDSEFMNYSYSIVLPDGYERSSVSAPQDVSISGYRTIDIDPKSGSRTADVSISIEKSEPGNASIDLEQGQYVYKCPEKNDTYVVRTGKNVSFNAIFEDPNGNVDEANYTWSIDGKMVSYEKHFVYSFADEKTYTVNLTVTDVGGKKAYSEVSVIGDGTKPTIVSDPQSSITLDEKQGFDFNASASHDNIDCSALHYVWDFGDGNTSVQAIVNHSYALWGKYTVTLNVTDSVGNYAIKEISVQVNDKTPPVAVFNWTDANNETHSSDDTGTATVTKGDSIYFDASPSYDPAGHDGTQHSITYSWYFEDTQSTSTEKVITHTFDKVGTYYVNLTVKDSAGNNRTVTKIFEVKHGPVPRLEVKNLTLSTSDPRAGQTIQIIANISNFGDANANSPEIVFYVNDKALSGSLKYYVYSNGTLVQANQTIPAGGYRVVKIDWTPEKGTVKLKVNATDPNEPSTSFLNEKEIKVTVGQPKWMDYIPVILAVIAIAGVIVVYVMYSKGMGPFSTEKKDKTKEKKEKK